jgi:hypothetical protein
MNLREGEIEQSPPSTAKVKNQCSCNFTPPILIHIVDRGKFYLYFLQTNQIYNRDKGCFHAVTEVLAADDSNHVVLYVASCEIVDFCAV